ERQAAVGAGNIRKIPEGRRGHVETVLPDWDVQVRSKRPGRRQARHESVWLEVVDEPLRLELLRNELRLELGRVRLDVDVEVQADPLEETVLDGDDAHFDRHGQVLQPPELFQELGDLLLHVHGLVDDQAHAEGEVIDGAGAAHVGPGARRDRVLDERDEQVLNSLLLAHRDGWGLRGGEHAGAWYSAAGRADRRAFEHGFFAEVRTRPGGLNAGVRADFVQLLEQIGACWWDEIVHRKDQVGDREGPPLQLAARPLFRRDLQRFIR